MNEYLSSTMESFYQFVLNLLKIVKPKHNYWVVGVLLITGLGMLSQPWWIQYLNLVFDKRIEASSGTEFTGWGLVFLAIFIHMFNRSDEKQEKLSSAMSQNISAEPIILTRKIVEPIVEASESRFDEMQSDFNNVEFHYMGNINGLTVRFSDVGLDSTKSLCLDKNKIITLLEAELRSHPILEQIDYESLPVPLKEGIFTVLTKLNNVIDIENVILSSPKLEITEAYSEFIGQYFIAYRLEFRKDHSLLRNRIKYKQAYTTITKLYEHAHRFMSTTYLNDHPDIWSRVHKLKGSIDFSLGMADMLYSQYINSDAGEEILGRVALSLDMAISSTHKILLEYSPPR